jgi:hypothetical protein
VAPSARWLVDDYVAPRLELAASGLFSVPRRPGLGFEVDRARVRHYTSKTSGNPARDDDATTTGVVDMILLTQAIVAVMACTVASGVAGGMVGAAVGRLAPSFVSWLHSAGGPGTAVDPTEFGFGLGVVCGLFLGAGTGLFLVLALRDVWLYRAGVLEVKTARDALDS